MVDMSRDVSTIKITWIDHGREPRHPADPRYPDGVDVDLSNGAARTCRVALPYPAPRCGLYAISCGSCGRSVLVTVAGRRDDPRSVAIACGSAR
jgi:hypothetical protein